jgi:UDP-N-acetylglucosamine 2-epimerase (non-hydrolysing)
MMKKNILCIVGTRPEAIKMAPIILALSNKPWANVRVIATAQHRQMLDQIFNVFHITPDVDLNIMQHNQPLPQLTSRLIEKLDETFAAEHGDLVLAQGDTTTVFAAALASFYQKIPFGHIEAGLRTGNIYNPYPEEMNRTLTARLTKLHFAPTTTAEKALLKEGVAKESIYVTGNTVIDALLETAQRDINLDLAIDTNKKIILVTAHRRESFGQPFVNICQAICALADEFTDIQIVYPVHPNPNIQKTALAMLANHPRILLCSPLEYPQLVTLMKQAYFILTDSGGIQEEAPALGKPVLVLRNETERTESIEFGVAKLVGSDTNLIISEATKLLTEPSHYASMVKGVSPYGDGKAALRIVDILEQTLITENHAANLSFTSTVA